MWSAPRRSTPAVRSGRVQRKNNHALTPHFGPFALDAPSVVRERPGDGYRHLLTVRDVDRFLELLPDWPELSKGLKGVVLARGSPSLFGSYRPQTRQIRVCAWPRTLAIEVGPTFIDESRVELDRIGVELAPGAGGVWCEFTESQARAFQLLFTLTHELGHHHDRMTTRRQLRSDRGEAFAQDYARAYADRIWGRYVDSFGWP
jgi:hypothetical protein